MLLPSHTFRHQWVTRAPIEKAWRVLSDTDRFNRMLDTGAEMRRERQPDGRVTTVGVLKTSGLTITWTEQPRQFVAPHWLLTERHYDNGPVEGLFINLALREVEQGTEVVFTATLVPRNALWWPIVFVRTRGFERSSLATLTRAIAHLDDGEDSYEPEAEPLSDQGDNLLEERLREVDSPIAGPLGDYIRHTPTYRQSRLSPLLLGRVWGIDDDTAIDGFLSATRAGVLKLSWELLCPNCRGGEVVVEQLPAGPVAAHCGSCNIRYDGGFLDACAINFKPVPEIRATDMPAACLMGPNRTPHVLARDLLVPGGRLDLTLALEPGTYRIESDRLEGAGTIEVVEDAPETELVFDLTERGVLPPRLRVSPGRRHIAVRSKRATADYVHVQARDWGPTILTAARFLSEKRARRMLPEHAIAPDLRVESRRGAVLAMDLLRGVDRDELDKVLSSLKPNRLQSGPLRITAYWGDPGQALRAALALARFPAMSVGMAVGIVLEVGDAAIGGVAAASARDAAQAAGAGRFLITSSVLEAPECKGILEGLELMSYGAFTALPAAPPHEQEASPELGEHFGDYTIGAPLGEGGFGVVYSATHVETGESAAVKVLRGELSDYPAYVERLYEECRLTARIVHPGIVKVLDYGFNEHGRLYLAMERLYGPLFSEEIEDRRGVELERAVAVAAAVLDVLHQAHAVGVVHCDVKSNNVVIAHDKSVEPAPYLHAGERVVLLDFGISSPIQHRFRTADTLGTLAFMAPEQLEGREVDARADIYGVGVMLLHAAYGTVPADRDRAANELPSWLSDIVKRALHPVPEKRWSTVEVMRMALLAGLASREEREPDWHPNEDISGSHFIPRTR
ncbi:MAG: hypothetical protein EP330_15825 [Deltaproteobacteria bacterium]|nr:MAG: hypothetical protein EP330_15825 [Deltaproteobacteria bacterium]